MLPDWNIFAVIRIWCDQMAKMRKRLNKVNHPTVNVKRHFFLYYNLAILLLTSYRDVILLYVYNTILSHSKYLPIILTYYCSICSLLLSYYIAILLSYYLSTLIISSYHSISPSILILSYYQSILLSYYCSILLSCYYLSICLS